MKEAPNTSILEKFPRLARSGVLIADLINRLNGKLEQVIKGVVRKPNKREAHHNWIKVFDYLRHYERMNSRFLFCESILFSTDEHPCFPQVFWGLLEDIFNAFTNKKASRRQGSTAST